MWQGIRDVFRDAIGAGTPKPATPTEAIESVFSPELSDEIIHQYQAGGSRPVDALTRALLAEFQADFYRKIHLAFRPVALALQNYNYVLIDDEPSVRAETRLGLKAFRLTTNGTSPADNIVGEYGDAASVLRSCLPTLDPEKKHIFVLDGSFPLGDAEMKSNYLGCEVVLAAIRDRGLSNIQVIIRSGQAGSPDFRAKVDQFPFVLAILHKAQQSCLFQWALAQHPEALRRLIWSE